jgi:exodeoxyribonuclease V beta subunit
MKEFNLGADPILGRNVLEASAGTGKTFTIAGLYLRLLLEQNLSVDKILVVTFTEAATAELNQRIRETLKTALRAFTHKLAGGAHGHDEYPAPIPSLRESVSAADAVGRITTNINEYPAPIPSLLETVTASDAVERLTTNLNTFDEASIYTIHGFCRTLLLENSFESGTQFGCELETDQQSLIESVVADYWRAVLAAAPPLLVSALTDATTGLGIDALTEIVKQGMDHLDAAIIPDAPASATDVVRKKYEAAFEKAKRQWEHEREAIVGLLAGSGELTQKTYKHEQVRAKADAADQYFAKAGGTTYFPDAMEIFTQRKIDASVNKNRTAPKHQFFTFCGTLKDLSAAVEEAVAADVLAVKRNAFEFVRSHLAERKKELNILSFNDLLITTRDAVCSEGSGALIDKLRSRYNAVLIDEFQDTDPVQYAIFSRLFADGGTVLFYIGDPKQAIYGFRGADVFAYMAATAQKDVRKATLALNYRSTPGLIGAVNAVFGHADKPFIFDGIVFSPVNHPADKKQGKLLIDGKEPPPLTIRFASHSRGAGERTGIALNKTKSITASIDATVDDIAAFLTLAREGKAVIEKGGERETLDENAIAVLVRTNTQARKMQEALLAAGVHSVIHSSESIFASHEAEEMLRVMNAAAEPVSAPLIRSALITTLLGMTASELDALNTDGVKMGYRHEQFMQLDAHWKRNGFIDMVSRLMEQEDMLSRILRLPEGERRAANLLQLTELLQKAESCGQLAPLALVKWLEKNIAEGDTAEEEYVENLATDQTAVKIATVHGSKGLQYKIVYCPFLWEVHIPGANSPEPAVFFHAEPDASGAARLTYDLGSTAYEKNKATFELETLAEQNRLAYVAMTRAEYHCTVHYGNYSSTERSSIAYLLHRTSDGAELTAILADEDRVFADLRRLEADAGGSIRIEKAAAPLGRVLAPRTVDAAQTAELAERPRRRSIDAAGTVASFTSLAVHTGREQRLSYVDEVQFADTAEPDGGVKNIFTFAKGKLAGDFFHEVFEKIDFAMADADAVISSRMKKYGLDDTEGSVAHEAVRNVLEKKLPQVAPDFSLSLLGPEDRRHETNFYVPLTPFVKRALRRFMHEYTNADERTLREEFTDGRVKGWLNGKIDLLFRQGDRYYIVDWKSNYLGGTRDAYDTENMRDAMVRDDYFLQSLLYIMGTDRYLRDRLPDYTYAKNFGGVFYIFLRGVDAAADDSFGVFFEKPDAGMIRRLDGLIAAPMPGAGGEDEENG